MPHDPQPRTTARGPSRPYVAIVVTYLCVLVVGMCLAWTFLSMRAVAGVGGSCASGGAYEIATPCPDGSWLIALAIPLMLIAMFAGSGFGMTIGAPALLLPMWAILFTSLGWNFLEFGIKDGVDIGFLVCGVMFWGMAAPAWWAMATALKKSVLTRLKVTDADEERTEEAAARASVWSAGSLEGSLWWWLIFAALGAGGAFLGVATYAVASS